MTQQIAWELMNGPRCPLDLQGRSIQVIGLQIYNGNLHENILLHGHDWQINSIRVQEWIIEMAKILQTEEYCVLLCAKMICLLIFMTMAGLIIA